MLIRNPHSLRRRRDPLRERALDVGPVALGGHRHLQGDPHGQGHRSRGQEGRHTKLHLLDLQHIQVRKEERKKERKVSR